MRTSDRRVFKTRENPVQWPYGRNVPKGLKKKQGKRYSQSGVTWGHWEMKKVLNNVCDLTFKKKNPSAAMLTIEWW